MKYTAKEVLGYVEENDVKFVKLTFCDLFGRQRNVSIVAQQLPFVFENGYAFNSSAIPGFKKGAGELLLFPDPKTLSVLPWRPRTGAVVSLLCNVKHKDGSLCECDFMHKLDLAKTKLVKHGINCEIATEAEFYVFKQNENGEPTDIPIDRAGYYDCAPDDAGENVRRDIILHLEDMGIVPTASHHEEGPGQNEIDFRRTEPDNAARNLLYFKSAVKNVCALSGMYATFEPEPIKGEAGSRLVVTLTLGGTASQKTLDCFINGIKSKLNEFLSLLITTPDGFKAVGALPACGEGSAVSSVQCADGSVNVVINCADCLTNPFLIFAVILEAGVFGIESETAKPECKELPKSLYEALELSEKSEWLKGVLSECVLKEYIKIKRKEHGIK